MRSVGMKESENNDRNFKINVPGMKYPLSVRYNIEDNSLLFDEGIENESDVVPKDMNDGKPFRINEFSLDPQHRAIWAAALPEINKYRELEKLPPLNGYNATTDAPPISASGPYTEGPDPFQDELEWNETGQSNGAPVMHEYPAGAETQQWDGLRHPADYLMTITTLSLVNNTLTGFLRKHIKEGDPDWDIIKDLTDYAENIRSTG